jgi:hypothetical protein
MIYAEAIGSFPALKSLLASIIPEHTQVDGFELDVAFKGVEEQRPFLFVEVDREMTKLPRLQRSDDRTRIDEAPARRVHQHGTRLHQREGLSIDDVTGRWQQRAVERNDMRTG